MLLNTVLFESEAAGRRVHLVSRPIDATLEEGDEFAGAMESMQGGWGGSLEVLEKLLASLDGADARQRCCPLQ